MALAVLPLFLNIFLSTGLYGKEKHHERSIVLVAIGEVEWKTIGVLTNDLKEVFDRRVLMGKGMSEPDYTFNRRRNQYPSTAILNAIMEQKEYGTGEKILGIVDHDPYVSELNFVFWGGQCESGRHFPDPSEARVLPSPGKPDSLPPEGVN
jgi:hypothetical protein